MSRADCADGARSYKESFEAWTPAQAEADQSMRELLCFEQALVAFDRRGVDFSDRTVRAALESEEARAALDLRPGEATATLRADVGGLEGQMVGYDTDNQGVRAVANKGGSRKLVVNAVVKRIWRWLLERGARVEVRWVSGLHMCCDGRLGVSTDGLSRQRWADACDWTFRPQHIHALRRWVSEWAEPVPVFTRDVVNGAVYTQLFGPEVIPIVFPGGNHLAEYIGHLRQTRARACVIVPLWHGPAMAAVARFDVESKQLGPAYALFRSPSRRKRVPGWEMRAVVVDFRLAGAGATGAEDGTARV